MALIEFQDLPNTTTPLTASNLNNNFNELHQTATTSTQGQMSATDKTKLNRIGMTQLTSGPISTKTTTTLMADINDFDMILVLATSNAYDHRKCATFLKGNLYDSMYQLIQFDETHWDNMIKIYGATIDTTSSTLLGTSTYHIATIYGIKIS